MEEILRGEDDDGGGGGGGGGRGGGRGGKFFRYLALIKFFRFNFNLFCDHFGVLMDEKFS